MMDIAGAFQIVLDLAKQNALDPLRCDRELQDEADRQQEAIDTVENFVVNRF